MEDNKSYCNSWCDQPARWLLLWSLNRLDNSPWCDNFSWRKLFLSIEDNKSYCTSWCDQPARGLLLWGRKRRDNTAWWDDFIWRICVISIEDNNSYVTMWCDKPTRGLLCIGLAAVGKSLSASELIIKEFLYYFRY